MRKALLVAAAMMAGTSGVAAAQEIDASEIPANTFVTSNSSAIIAMAVNNAQGCMNFALNLNIHQSYISGDSTCFATNGKLVGVIECEPNYLGEGAMCRWDQGPHAPAARP